MGSVPLRSAVQPYTGHGSEVFGVRTNASGRTWSGGGGWKRTGRPQGVCPLAVRTVRLAEEDLAIWGGMTDWEERYRTGETPWDKGAPHPVLGHGVAPGWWRGRVLVPGCGFGFDAAAIAESPAVTMVTGLDVAASAVAGAQDRWKGISKVEFVTGDWFAPPAEWAAAFDRVWEHTCFCAIEPDRRADYVRAAATVLRPGGEFIACFYLTPWDSPDEEGWPGPPFGTTLAELDDRFDPHFELIEEGRPPVTYPGREGREWLRRYQRR